MKGKLTAVALLIALAVPAGADAAKRELSGKIDGGGRIGVTLKTTNAGNSVGAIRIKRIVVNCEGTRNRLSFGIRGGAPITPKRRFRVRASDGTGGHSRIRGRFNRSFKRVRGTIRVFGRFAAQGGGTLQCDSGVERFRAR